jgi:hypothetical protein
MTTPEQRSMKNWTPAEHIDEACRLAEKQAKDADAGTRYMTTPISLTRALVHCAIAEAKMHGRGRA